MTNKTEKINELAKIAVDRIIYDLTDRRGLKQEYNAIDPEIQREIIHKWENIIIDNLKKLAATNEQPKLHEEDKVQIAMEELKIEMKGNPKESRLIWGDLYRNLRLAAQNLLDALDNSNIPENGNCGIVEDARDKCNDCGKILKPYDLAMLGFDGKLYCVNLCDKKQEETNLS